MIDIKTAAQALVDKLDIALTKIDDAIKIATIHGHAYDGPQFSHELNNLKTALERDKAIDELVKHDQEIGRYDAHECDASKDCPKQWGEPFYGSEEISKVLNGALGGNFDSILSEWVSCKWGYMLIRAPYRLPANHPFYQTDLFANAQKPDADHPCRGGE